MTKHLPHIIQIKRCHICLENPLSNFNLLKTKIRWGQTNPKGHLSHCPVVENSKDCVSEKGKEISHPVLGQEIGFVPFI
jgi:hypothetical protein